MTAADVTFQDYRLVNPDQVTPHPDNPRRGHLAAITESIRTNGFYGAIVVQASTSRVIAGNHRLLAARQLGLTQIPATFVDVDDQTALRILAVDNRANDLAGYDNDALLELLTTLDATETRLEGTGYTDADLDQLLNPQGPPALTDADDVPDAPALPVTQPGDVWLLGPHRLLCGDATDLDTWRRLCDGRAVDAVVTDPPYGINLDADYSKMPGGNATSKMHRTPNKYRQIQGDDVAFDAAPFRALMAGVKEQFWFGADYYRSTLTSDDRDGSWLVWDKRNEDQDDVIGSGYELCWSATSHQRRILRHYWCGAFGAVEARNRMHPTQKPVALFTDILTRWTPEHGLIADGYAGSGSVLIACHETGRAAALAEIDPAYCDVILQRFTDHTGITPTNQDTGQQWAGKRHTSETAAV